MAIAIATKKNVLNVVINMITDGTDVADIFKDYCEDAGFTYDDGIYTLQKMLEQVSKPRTKTESKAAKANREFLSDVLRGVEPGTTFTAHSFAETNNVSSSKASAILKQGVTDKVLTVTDGKNGKVYTIA